MMMKIDFLLRYFFSTDHLVMVAISLCLATGPHAGAYAKPATGVVKRIVVTTDGQRCPIQLVDPYGARVTESGYVLDHFPYQRDGLGELLLEFRCVSLTNEDYIKHLVASRYNESTGKWEKDVSWLEPMDQRVTRTFPIQGSHDSGMAMMREATNGDPRMRDRLFGFCLRHPPLALCGVTPQIARPYYKRSDLLPFARTIIKSIEFVDFPSGETAVGTTSEATSVSPFEDGQ